jgi:cyclase
MLRPRIAPCLLVHQGGLVKTTKFCNPKYVGDPINAVRIFNEKEVDELVVFDIDATAKGVEPDYRMIANLADESRMPLTYGGGVMRPDQAKRIVGLGVEKVSISAAAVANPDLVAQMADAIGRQSVAVVVDTRKKRLAPGYEMLTHNATRLTRYNPIEFAADMAAAGAGEIIVNAIDRDGTMQGYDLALARQVRAAVKVPISMVGGAGSLEDVSELIREVGVVGAVAGSLFVFKGPYRAVLINYPQPDAREAQVQSAMRQYAMQASRARAPTQP